MVMHWLNIRSTGARFHETHIRTLFPGARRLGHDSDVDSFYEQYFVKPFGELASDYSNSCTSSQRSLKPIVRASDVTSDHLLSAGAWPASSCMRVTPESSPGTYPIYMNRLHQQPRNPAGMSTPNRVCCELASNLTSFLLSLRA